MNFKKVTFTCVMILLFTLAAIDLVETGIKYYNFINKTEKYIMLLCQDVTLMNELERHHNNCAKAVDDSNISFSEFVSKHYMDLFSFFSFYVVSLQPITSENFKSIFYWGVLLVFPAVIMWSIHRHYDYLKTKYQVDASSTQQRENNQLLKNALRGTSFSSHRYLMPMPVKRHIKTSSKFDELLKSKNTNRMFGSDPSKTKSDSDFETEEEYEIEEDETIKIQEIPA